MTVRPGWRYRTMCATSGDYWEERWDNNHHYNINVRLEFSSLSLGAACLTVRKGESREGPVLCGDRTGTESKTPLLSLTLPAPGLVPVGRRDHLLLRVGEGATRWPACITVEH